MMTPLPHPGQMSRAPGTYRATTGSSQLVQVNVDSSSGLGHAFMPESYYSSGVRTKEAEFGPLKAFGRCEVWCERGTDSPTQPRPGES